MDPETIRKEIERRKALDALVNYVPGPTAAKFLASPAKRRLIYTNNQMGKTTAMQVDCAMTMRGIHPHRPWCGPVRGLVVVPQRRQASTIWGDRMLVACKMPGRWEQRPWIPEWEIANVKWDHSPSGRYPGRITLKNGSELFIALSGNPNSWKSIEGEVFDAVWRDEADGNENLGDELDLRLIRAASKAERALQSGGEVAAWWLGSLSWCYTPTKANDEAETFREHCVSGTEGYEMFSPDPTVQEENPAVSVSVRAGLAKTMSAEAFAVRGIGSGTTTDAAKIYADIIHRDKERLLRIEPWEPRPDDNTFIGYDPGFTRDPCGIMCGVIPRSNPTWLIVQAWFSYRKGNRMDHINTMREWLAGRACAWMVCDPAIQRTESNGISFFVQFQEDIEAVRMKMHAPPIKGRNKNDDGLPLVQDYLSAKDPDRQIIFDMTGPGVADAVKQLEQYRWRIDSNGNITKTIYTSRKVRDESPDVIKYLLSMYPYWIDYGQDPAVAAPEEVDAAKSPEEIRHDTQMKLAAKLHDDWFAERSGRPGGGRWPF